MKKVALMLLAAILCFSLFSCDSKKSEETVASSQTVVTTENETTIQSEASTEVSTVTDAETTEETETTSETEEITTETSVESTETSENETTSETEAVTTTETTTETETETEENKAMEYVDFVVSVPEGREPVILQLTDTQIIDTSQCRTSDRLGSTHMAYWAPDKKNVRCYDFLEEIIYNTEPDLILVTGDIVYGEFDDSGESLLEFVAFMESMGVPWAPVFGNHENESKMGADWQSQQFENAENCLFLQRKLTGNGNYTVGIEQGGKLTRVFFMVDSNGCGGASEETMANNHTQREQGFAKNQIAWYTKTAKSIKAASPDTKLSFAFHIQLEVFSDAFARYTTDPNTHVFIDYAANKQEGDFGYIHKHYTGFDSDRSVWNGLKELGVDSIFVGHEHANSASIVYEGVRLQFGMKSTSYDSLNYVTPSGNIEHSYYSTVTPWVGGTVFNLDSEGNIVDPHIYYCKDGGAKIDWDSIYAVEEESEDVFEELDFIVEVPVNRDPVILHLTDMQIIDSSQQRYDGRLGGESVNYWAPDKKDVRCYDYLTEIITATNPDLILITGDLVYGEFDDNGENFLELIEFMESFNIPWAPVFGNHDNESKMGVDWQCEQLEKAENCLFLQRKMTGNGNYTVGIKQGDKLTRVFFMLDSNGCGAASSESLANGHTSTSVGFGADQVKWYKNVAKKINQLSPDTKLSMAFHIQIAVFGDAFAKYGSDGKTQVNIDQLDDKYEGDFGFIGAAMKGPWDSDRSLWNSLKELGFDSVLVGHEHANSASIVYEGIRLQYGMKCSTYDRNNYITATGKISSEYYSTETPWIGGTYFKLSSDGSIKDGGIYYCKDAGGNIDWDSFKPKVEAAVNGLQKSDVTLESGISMTGVKFDDNVNAFEITASSQGKVKINTELLKNKSTFTFTVYVPAESNVKLGGLGEFAIRTKPNSIEPDGDGTNDPNAHGGGYIDYNSSQGIEDYRIIFDTWQTFTVDISDFGEDCTEFAFVIAAGNTIYLRDMVIE